MQRSATSDLIAEAATARSVLDPMLPEMDGFRCAVQRVHPTAHSFWFSLQSAAQRT
jgi:hypothetical protein